MRKIRAIPKIPPAILDAARRGDLVVFFGAGVSRIIGCPSWKDFANAYLEKILEQKKINYFEYDRLLEKDPRMVLTICQKIIKEEKVESPDINEILKGDPEKIKKHRIYENLYKFKAVYVTTNFDDYMDEVVKKNKKKKINPRSVTVAESALIPDHDDSENYIHYVEKNLLLTALKSGSVVHLHGSVQDIENLVITLPDYFKKYTPESNSTFLIKEIFEKRTVLLIGYGLDEYEIIEFLVNKSNISNKEISHFMLFGAFEEEGNMVELYNKYYAELGVELIPFSMTKRGHAQLVNIIKVWAKEIGSIARERLHIDKRSLIDETD